jgi:mannose/cellobiose epimerase-like protein (N-acyl-D-glucosamine 2-epimerase family)
MNDQIRELWRECVMKHTNDPMNWQNVADEFAGMIIKKCCDAADDWYQNHNDIHWDPAQHIRNNLGVE